MYFFPGMLTFAFVRDEVLNHRLRHKLVILPGDEIAGILMGLGDGRLPDGFHDRERFTTRLSAYYGRGKRSDLEVDFMVNLNPERTRIRKAAKAARSSKGSEAATAPTGAAAAAVTAT